jgi:hypothetical protein
MEETMKKLLMIIGVAALLVLNASAASACMCTTIGSPKTNLAEVQAVFLGKIVAAKKHEWTIAVDRVWKGEIEEKVLMRDPSAGSSCESHFKLGDSYIFFAYVKESKRKVIFNPAVCTWTTSLTYRHEGVLLLEFVLKELGEGQPPIKKIPKEKASCGKDNAFSVGGEA